MKGLITETTPLNFPENAAIDLSNFELSRDGSIARRLGIAIEATGTDIDTSRAATSIRNYAITTYKWENVGNDPDTSIGVIQIGNRLWFTDLFADTQSTAMLNKDSSGVVQALDLNDENPIDISGNFPLSYAAVGGVLVIASAEMDYPVYLEFSGVAEDGSSPVSVSPIRIKVRDIWGVFDGLEVDERPPALTPEHEYNLMNQGWPDSSSSSLSKSYTREKARGNGSYTLGEVYPDLFTSFGFFKAVAKVGNGRYGRYASSTYEGGTRRQYEQIEYLKRTYGFGAPSTTLMWDSAETSGYPANSDIRSIGEGVNQDGDPNFDPARVNILGPASTTPAPRGRFIIDAFDRGASRQEMSGKDTGYLDSELGNISKVISFANRIFYSGISSNIDEAHEESPDYTGCLFFTQSIQNFGQFTKCYQQADPTDEEDNTLVATDGGFIKIAEAADIVKLVTARSSLVVFATNGVWEIKGPDGVFSATDFAINQVTNIGCASADSVIVAEDNVFYWSDGGIYVLTPDQISGNLNAQNITETTIQTFFNNIPDVGKQFCKGRFDPVNRKVTWLYNDSSDYDGVSFPYKYNKELVFDTVLQAFYPRAIADSSEGRFLAAYLETESFVVVNEVQDVVVNGEPVVVNGEQVVVTVPQRSRGNTVTKYLTLSPTGAGDDYQFTFAFYGDVDYLDWGETDSSAFLITGYELGGDTQRRKQVPYLTTHFNRSETGFEEVDGELESINGSSCTVTARWDFADSSTYGKWGTPFEAYRLNRNFLPTGTGDSFDYGQSVVTSKTKLRGRGRAVSIKFETAPAKDCQLIGWGMPITGGTTV